MRPDSLTPLFAEITSLKGVAAKSARQIARLAGPRLVDLLAHRPSGVIDRRAAPPIAELQPGQMVTIKLSILHHQPPARRGLPHRIAAADATGTLDIVYFNAKGDWLQRTYPVGGERVVSGRVEFWQGRAQIVHPDFSEPPDKAASIPAIEPVYPMTEGLHASRLRSAIAQSVAAAPDLPEWLDPALLKREGWPGWRAAIKGLHAPEGLGDLLPLTPVRRRLGYDEMLADQLALALIRQQRRRKPGREIQPSHELRARLIGALPFRLTSAQSRVIGEIDADMAAPFRMLRLLQGDVGSGKTVVALIAALNAIGAGGQAAMMAPTEILARQHGATLQRLSEPIGLRIAILTGRIKGRARTDLLAEIAEGRIDLVVGTQALFSEDVAFHDLALAIIDEQHRFGVHDRLNLSAKGVAVDTLVMTATPIPRTLCLTAFGDMEVSRIDERPPGRTPIDTRVLPISRMGEIVAAVGRKLAVGEKTFWVCPLVEESDKLDVTAAESRARSLRETFGEAVALVHGRQKPAEKDAEMARFAEGDAGILVATTVIEVGVDVPAATLMVVEHAERFGLAQLHQLRGRVGRGSGASTCLLLYDDAGEVARDRLRAIRESDDGFHIAEEDLRLRGPGEILGTAQSGLPRYRYAELPAHEDLLEIAAREVRLIIETDPKLAGPRGEALRTLLYLFERDSAIRYLSSG